MTLITGGAGYIGSHITDLLIKSGRQVIVLDNLSTGFRDAVDSDAEFIEGDIRDKNLLAKVFASHRISAVIHLAAFTEVERSVREPLEFYDNNVAGTLALLEQVRKVRNCNFVFSSSAAVYGDNATFGVKETATPKPQNAYGRSKWICEQMIENLASATPDFRYISLRYFNVAGASIEGHLGQRTKNATHMVKVAAETASGKRAKMSIFGDDYDTEDGTCIRDYIHVQDLAQAHLLALEYLTAGGASDTLNVGYGKGYSVKEVIDTMANVSGKKFTVEIGGRRPGDVPVVVADPARIVQIMKYQPRFDDLNVICKTAYDFELTRS